MKMIRKQHGFTLPELVVVAAIIFIMAFVSFILLNRTVSPVESENGLRRTSVALIAQALQQFKAETGGYPADIPEKATEISSLGAGYDLCRHLVPRYVPDLPPDPTISARYRAIAGDRTPESCDTEGVNYSLGYTIMTKNGAITIGAPNAVKEKIEITIN